MARVNNVDESCGRCNESIFVCRCTAFEDDDLDDVYVEDNDLDEDDDGYEEEELFDEEDEIYLEDLREEEEDDDDE